MGEDDEREESEDFVDEGLLFNLSVIPNSEATSNWNCSNALLLKSDADFLLVVTSKITSFCFLIIVFSKLNVFMLEVIVSMERH